MSTPLLRQFVSKILSIDAPVINLFGGGIPGMAGDSAAVQGATSSGSDVLAQLKDQTFHFAATYEDPTSSSEAVKEIANAVEGSILNSSVLSIITGEEADTLIDQLHDIVSSRA